MRRSSNGIRTIVSPALFQVLMNMKTLVHKLIKKREIVDSMKNRIKDAYYTQQPASTLTPVSSKHT